MSSIDPTTPAAASAAADVREQTQQPDAEGTKLPDADARADTDTVRIDVLVRQQTARMVEDTDTHVLQIEVLDATTRQILREIPEKDWLQVVRALRTMAAEAIVDKKA